MFESPMTSLWCSNHSWLADFSNHIADNVMSVATLLTTLLTIVISSTILLHMLWCIPITQWGHLPWNVLHSLQQLSGMSDAVKACTSWWQINGFTTSLRLVYFTLLQGFWYIVAHLQGTPYTFLFGFPCKMCRSFPCFSLEIDLWFSLASIARLSHWL